MRRQPGREGYTLTEVMVCLTLWGTFSLVASHVVFGVTRTFRDAGAAADAAGRLDVALAAVRTDLSTATGAEVPDPRTLVVHGPADVRWSADAGGLSRAAGASVRRWDLGRPVTVGREGEAVLVRASADPADAVPMAIGGGR